MALCIHCPDLAGAPRKPRTPRTRRRRRRRSEAEQERTMPKQLGHDDDDDFTFPTPPPQLLAVAANHRSSRSRVSPVVLAPIRRSFSAADIAASMWGWGSSPRAACSPALSDYAAGYSDLEEEVMDSLWQNLNDDEEAPAAEGKKDTGDNIFRASPDVSHRLSFGSPSQPVEGRRPTAATTKDQLEGAPAVQLPASRSSRRRPVGLAVVMHALKKMLVAHKSRSKVHKVDEQGAAATGPPAATTAASSSSRRKKRF